MRSMVEGAATPTGVIPAKAGTQLVCADLSAISPTAGEKAISWA